MLFRSGENHENIARLWSAYLDTLVAPSDVALMMALAKIARTKTGELNPDDFIDMAGYAGIAGELAYDDYGLPCDTEPTDDE